jgi:hypothetical protein
MFPECLYTAQLIKINQAITPAFSFYINVFTTVIAGSFKRVKLSVINFNTA